MISHVSRSQSSLKADKRLLMLEAAMKQHQYRKDSLLEILHTAQELYGYLDKDLLTHVSKSLHLPPGHVYGVATFYHFFKMKKPGQHVVSVCMGTACYVKGAEEILSSIEREFNVRHGETSLDGRLSVFVTRCIGGCAMAPNVVVDEEVMGKAAKETVLNNLRTLLGGKTVEAR